MVFLAEMDVMWIERVQQIHEIVDIHGSGTFLVGTTFGEDFLNQLLDVKIGTDFL